MTLRLVRALAAALALFWLSSIQAQEIVFDITADTRDVVALFVPPSTRIRVPGNTTVTATIDAQVQSTVDDRGQLLTVPSEPGLLPLRVTTASHDIRLNVFVQRARPLEATELRGYQIGTYPPPEAYGANYAPPSHLLEVTPSLLNAKLSPHFRVADFLCKQPSGWPKYVVVQPKLLERLEQVVTLLNDAGFDGSKLVVMSGYRTPAYNKGLGNALRSRHIFGDAADVYLDADNDGVMDDVNRDGQLDIGDAEWLLKLLETHPSERLKGGMSVYPPNPYHGAFLHIDTRGRSVRW